MEEKTLVEKMLTFRAKHGISQRVFADLCGLSTQTVCNVERGLQKPSNLTKYKILNVIKGE